MFINITTLGDPILVREGQLNSTLNKLLGRGRFPIAIEYKGMGILIAADEISVIRCAVYSIASPTRLEEALDILDRQVRPEVMGAFHRSLDLPAAVQHFCDLSILAYHSSVTMEPAASEELIQRALLAAVPLFDGVYAWMFAGWVTYRNQDPRGAEGRRLARLAIELEIASRRERGQPFVAQALAALLGF